MSSTYSIPRIESGATTEEEALRRFNSPIESTEEALNTLSRRMDSIGGKCSVIYEHAPLSADCTAGTLVYYRPADNDNPRGEFAPAQAKLKPLPGEQGQTVEDDCARVIGMVIRLDADTGPLHGALLCGGYWEDLDGNTSVVHACLGSDALPGTYYLSPSTPGKAVPESQLGGHLRQGVLTYLGDGKICFGLHYLAHDDHWHGSCVLSRDGWVAVSDRLPDDVAAAPEGYGWWYDTETNTYEAVDTASAATGSYAAVNSAIATLGELSERTTAVFYNGLLIPQGGSFTVFSGYLWYNGNTAPDNGSVTVFNSYPFAYNNPLVRAIVSENDALVVSNRNGTISLRQNAFVQGGTDYKPTAVYSISGRTITNTYVVSKIEGGPGITVDDTVGGGKVRVSLSDLVGSALHDAYVVDHNGTNQAHDGIYPYIMFPAGRTCGLTMTLPVTSVDAGTALAARVWIMGLTHGSYEVTTRFLPQPSRASAVSLDNVVPVTSELAGGADGRLTYSETPNYVRIVGPGTLVSEVRVTTAPDTDRKVFRLGYRLELLDIEDSGHSVISGTPVPAVINSAMAYDDISAGMAVRVAPHTNGELMPCGSSRTDNANECIGIAKNDARQGTTVEYVSSGVIDMPGYSFSAGDALYIGPTGLLVLTPPETDDAATFAQRVGTAITETRVQINIETAVIK